MAKKRTRSQRPNTPSDLPLPQTLDEAIAFLQRVASPEVIAEIKSTPFDELIRFHRDIGMQVRNTLGLWGRNPALLECIPAQERWPDNAAMYIIEAWWHSMQTPEPPQ